jgi:predicted enzyme related to lactoylglutathione lyase
MKNVITWFDIPTEDFDRAVKFYSDILGNEIRVDTFMGRKLGFFPMEGMDGWSKRRFGAAGPGKQAFCKWNPCLPELRRNN